MIKVKVLKESGYDEALLGISLSYGSDLDKMPARAAKLAHMQGGHNAFLELMQVWLDVTAPRYWWAQADRYRLSAKLSESTMHTICKRELAQEDFAEEIPESWLDDLNMLIRHRDNSGALERIKQLLPESFLQRRVWLCSYKTLQNIIYQRHAHKLPEWQVFCHEVIDQVQHPQFIHKG